MKHISAFLNDRLFDLAQDRLIEPPELEDEDGLEDDDGELDSAEARRKLKADYDDYLYRKSEW
jgi:hypothetical protein